MFKQIFAIFRGTAQEAAQNYTDRHALIILRQQINDSATAVQTARKAVAVAMAQNKQEEEQYNNIVSKIKDLEERAIVALEKGKKQIATEAAETIAYLEAERDTSKQAIERFKSEIERLRQHVREAESRLRDLKRGHRIADATDKTQKMRETADNSSDSALQDAEATLERLRLRQKQIDQTAEAMAEMDEEKNADRIIEKLAGAGCGDALKSSADDVLERLSKHVKKSA